LPPAHAGRNAQTKGICDKRAQRLHTVIRQSALFEGQAGQIAQANTRRRLLAGVSAHFSHPANMALALPPAGLIIEVADMLAEAKTMDASSITSNSAASPFIPPS